MRHSKKLLRLAANGPIRASDLRAAGIPRSYLVRFSNSGQLQRVSRGVYQLLDPPNATELSTVAAVAKRVPGATVCLLTALQVHGLTTEIPGAVWLMIDRKARSPTIDTPAIEVVRASGPALTTGVEMRKVEGVAVKMTNPPKTVADCFRYRRHVGMEVALAALRDYLRKYRGGMDALVSAAKADRIWPFMRPYVEALV